METERHANRAGSPHRRSESNASIAWSAGRVPIFDSVATSARPLPDLPLCAACEAEILDPSNRRFHYAFTSCAVCGPRRSILERGSLIRANTPMACFPMCASCRTECETPGSRRFRDELVSCPSCGPALELLTESGTRIKPDDSIRLAVGAILDQRILAIRDERRDWLCCDATSSIAVSRIRSRRGDHDVPLTVMVRDLEAASRIAELTAKEESLLTSVERPVVLVSIRTDSPLTGEVAAGNRLVSLLLPYTPLHHILLQESGRPLVSAPAGVPDALPRSSESALLEMADLLLIADRTSRDQAGNAQTAVQHHHAHMAACLAEHDEAGSALGVVFDFGGIGAGDTSQGGEIFRGTVDGIERLATFRPIALGGAHVSSRQIWRVALAMLDEVWSGAPPLHAIPLFRSIPRRAVEVVRRVLDTGPTVRSRAIGLQIEALAAIVLGRPDSSQLGVLTAEWDALADPQEAGRYPIVIRDGSTPWELDLRPVVKCAVSELIDGRKPAVIAARVRSSIVAAVTEVLLAHGGDRIPVAISGRYFERTNDAARLAERLGPNARVLRPCSLPAGDGACGGDSADDLASRPASLADECSTSTTLREL